MKRKVLTVDQIYKDYGYKPNTLKYLQRFKRVKITS